MAPARYRSRWPCKMALATGVRDCLPFRERLQRRNESTGRFVPRVLSRTLTCPALSFPHSLYECDQRPNLPFGL